MAHYRNRLRLKSESMRVGVRACSHWRGVADTECSCTGVAVIFGAKVFGNCTCTVYYFDLLKSSITRLRADIVGAAYYGLWLCTI